MSTISDVPNEILELILLSLHTDRDLHYLVARRVCKLWYAVYTGLKSRGYQLDRWQCIDSMSMYPKYIPQLVNTDGVGDYALRICMRSGINIGDEILNCLGSLTTATRYALQYNRPEFVSAHLDELGQVQNKWLAFVYHHRMQQFYEVPRVAGSCFRYTFPDETCDAEKVEFVARSVFCMSHTVFDTDTPEHAARVRDYLHAKFSPADRQRIYRDMNSRMFVVNTAYRYLHTLRALSDEYTWTVKCVHPSGEFYKNAAVWEFFREHHIVPESVNNIFVPEIQEWWLQKIQKN